MLDLAAQNALLDPSPTHEYGLAVAYRMLQLWSAPGCWGPSPKGGEMLLGAVLYLVEKLARLSWRPLTPKHLVGYMCLS